MVLMALGQAFGFYPQELPIDLDPHLKALSYLDDMGTPKQGAPLTTWEKIARFFSQFLCSCRRDDALEDSPSINRDPTVPDREPTVPFSDNSAFENPDTASKGVALQFTGSEASLWKSMGWSETDGNFTKKALKDHRWSEADPAIKKKYYSMDGRRLI